MREMYLHIFYFKIFTHVSEHSLKKSYHMLIVKYIYE